MKHSRKFYVAGFIAALAAILSLTSCENGESMTYNYTITYEISDTSNSAQAAAVEGYVGLCLQASYNSPYYNGSSQMYYGTQSECDKMGIAWFDEVVADARINESTIKNASTSLVGSITLILKRSGVSSSAKSGNVKYKSYSLGGGN